MMKYRGIPAGYEDDLSDTDDGFDFGTQNLKITIVPDITAGAGLNGENFDSELSEEMDDWFYMQREMLNSYKRNPAAQHNLKAVFMKDPQPLLLALKLFAKCPGRNNLKNKNAALFILETVCNLHKQQPTIADSCDDNMRMIAFNFIKTCGIVSLYKSVIETYELHKIRDLLVPKLRELISQGHFKDVGYWAMYLDVTHVFSIFDIAFPLLLQDKIYLAEEYLNVVKEQQLPMVQFLDSLLDDKKTVAQKCDEVIAKYKYVDVNHSNLSYRPMSKLITRMAKKYKVAPQYTPNLNFAKSSSHLHYLYHKYKSDGMSCDAWRELVCDTANTKALQVGLITKIASYGDITEACYWFKYFKVPTSDYPIELQAKLQQGFKGLSDDNYSGTDDTVDASGVSSDRGATKYTNLVSTQQDYLQLKLPADCILLIDTKQKFLDMITYLEAEQLIAFDSEWKPSFCSDNIVCLLQLATSERAYLLDCLVAEFTEDLWKLLGQKIFNNLEILKIGFSLQYDLRMLQKSLPLQLDLQTTSCYLDLSELWRRLKYMQFDAYPFHGGFCVGESLCALTELCLGKKLDKSNQCSNWANRPLRHDQIVYAALDAYCLLQIYEVLGEILLRMGLDIEQVVEEITTAKTGYLYRMKRVAGAQQLKKAGGGSSSSNPISVTDVKFLCDGMHPGLAKELRKLGIDCIDISTLDVKIYIDVAKRENRYVLTNSSRYELFARELPQSQCIQIPLDSIVEQLQNIISYLNIEVHERNLFTRCLQCNGNEFILVPNEQMQIMRFGEVVEKITRPPSNAAPKIVSDKTFQLFSANEHITNTKTTFRGRPVKMHRIKRHILLMTKYFYICDNCGTCTWDNAHPISNTIMKIVTTGSRTDPPAK